MSTSQPARPNRRRTWIIPAAIAAVLVIASMALIVVPLDVNDDTREVLIAVLYALAFGCAGLAILLLLRQTGREEALREQARTTNDDVTGRKAGKDGDHLPGDPPGK